MKNYILLLAGFLFIQEAASQSIYNEVVKYRNIGPFRGGRSVTATGVIGDPMTYYMGNTGAGLWKTTNAGQKWENISDGYFKTSSVGAVAVSASDPNIVYVGMGEHAPRGVMTTYGDGVYKSYDAGKTWEKIGLDKTQHISRVVIHPNNPDIVYVAAQGALHGNNTERGIYKTVDGGMSWTKVLYVNDMTGCSELSMDLSNPNVLYATMWEHQRKPWKVISGGPGSGVYKSTDAGKTWNQIHTGLPEEKGKMAIAVSQSNPEKVYLLMESDTDKDLSGLFVSNNGGANWSKVSGDNRLTQRAWYYIEVFVDPKDEFTLYVLSAPALRSIDGGKTWERLSGTHGDYHDLWINPQNTKNMVIANDGGAAISFDWGKTWSTQGIMPTAQFYRVSVDNLFPYNLYGGQQDNTSVKIASMALDRYTISEQDWTYAAGGESAFLAYDPDDPKYVLGGSYLGTIEILDMDSKASTKIMAAPNQYLGEEARNMKYLFNWNAPIIRSLHEENTYYHAAQVLLKTTDDGYSWQEVSPDLTRNDDSKQGNGGGPYTNEAVGAENYGTISYIIESSHEAGVIWTGSDDGLVYLTRNNGESWTNVTPKGLQETLVNAIDISPHDPATAYIATTRYKFDDKTPALYKTTDYGKSWTNISDGIPYGAYTRVIREDDAVKDLLYAGTETGMYISRDGGKSWTSLQLNLPVVPITDLQIKNGNLVVATMGRSFWILDDLSVIRQHSKISSTFTLYDPSDAIYGNWSSSLNRTSKSFDGTHPYEGVNPANGVVLYYNLPEEGSNDLVLEIKDSQGKVIRRIDTKGDPDYQRYDGGPPPKPKLSTDKGLNRFVWDTRHPIMKGAPATYIEASYRGHKSSPGLYTASLVSGENRSEVEFSILPHPLLNISGDQYQEYDDFMSNMESELSDMHKKVNLVLDLREQLDDVIKRLGEEEKFKQLKEEAMTLTLKMKEWDDDMIQRKSLAYDDVENFPNKFTANYLFLINQTESSIPRVNKANKERYEELSGEWEKLDARAEEILNSDVPALNKKLWELGVGALQKP